jgi:hypothetical protein
MQDQNANDDLSVMTLYSGVLACDNEHRGLDLQSYTQLVFEVD